MHNNFAANLAQRRRSFPHQTTGVPVRVGVNLPRPDYFSPDVPLFRDLIKSSPHFEVIGGGATCPINLTDGYPIHDFRIMVAGSVAGTLSGLLVGDCSSIVYNGSGSVSLGSYNSGTNTRPFTITRTAKEWATIDVSGTKRTSGSSTNTGVQSIVILRPGDSTFTDIATRVYTDDYKAFLATTNGYLRCMDLASTNNNGFTRSASPDADNRPTTLRNRTADWYDNTGTNATDLNMWGYPDEDIIALAQETQRDPWVCVPAGADDSYVTAMATRFFTGLTHAQNVVVEYANELWNNGTEVTYQVRNITCRLLDGYFDSVESGAKLERRLQSCTSDGTVLTLTFAEAHNRSVSDTVWFDTIDADNPYSGPATVTAVPSSLSIKVNIVRAAGNIRNNSSFSMLGKLDPDPTHPITFAGTGGDNANMYSLAQKYAERRICQISDLWRAVWGDSNMNTRVKCVWADQATGNPAGGELNDMYTMMTAAGGRALGGSTAAYLTALAGGGYVSLDDTDIGNLYGSSLNSGGTAQPISTYVTALTAITQNYTKHGYADFEQRALWASHYGLKSWIYEGGPDTFGPAGGSNTAANQAKTDAQYDATCKAAWLDLLNSFFSQGGEDFVWYHGGVKPTGYDGQNGAWEVIRDITDRTTAKISAIIDTIAAGRHDLGRNSAFAGAVIDARQEAEAYLDGAVPNVDPNVGTRNIHCGFFDFGAIKWPIWNLTNSPQTLNLTIHYTCNFAQTGTWYLNGTAVGGLQSFNDSPADHTTVKALSPISVTLRPGFNALFIFPTSPGQGDDVHIRNFSF